MRQTPLDLLSGEVSYGVNAVHLLYNQTSWRPTHLVVGDVTAKHRNWVYEGARSRTDSRVKRFLEIIEANKSSQIHIRGGYRNWVGGLLGLRRNVSFFPVCTHHSMGIGDKLEDKAPPEWHLPEVCRWGGSTLMAIQLAAQEGYEPLYVVGCDLGYKMGTNNHFAPEYDETIGRAKAKALNAVMGNAHHLASASWGIYNAGAGGMLEAYPRVKFEELF